MILFWRWGFLNLWMFCPVGFLPWEREGLDLIPWRSCRLSPAASLWFPQTDPPMAPWAPAPLSRPQAGNGDPEHFWGSRCPLGVWRWGGCWMRPGRRQGALPGRERLARTGLKKQKYYYEATLLTPEGGGRGDGLQGYCLSWEPQEYPMGWRDAQTPLTGNSHALLTSGVSSTQRHQTKNQPAGRKHFTWAYFTTPLHLSALW